MPVVENAPDADLPDRCWRHDMPVEQVRRVLLDNYASSNIRGFDDWRAIRWPVCARCVTERRRAMRRALAISAGCWVLVAAAITVIGNLWTLWLFLGAGIATFVAVHDARWARIIGVTTCDRHFSWLRFDIAARAFDPVLVGFDRELAGSLLAPMSMLDTRTEDASEQVLHHLAAGVTVIPRPGEVRDPSRRSLSVDPVVVRTDGVHMWPLSWERLVVEQGLNVPESLALAAWSERPAPGPVQCAALASRAEDLLALPRQQS
jgi:hypothetical protein